MGKDATQTLRIHFLTLGPYHITHFSVGEYRTFFVPVRIGVNVTNISQVPLRNVMVVPTRHSAHNLLNLPPHIPHCEYSPAFESANAAM